jgi:enoyl-CoA hydratase/carnithine racemase
VTVVVDNKTGFTILSLNRPPLSSFTLELLKELNEALDNVERSQTKGVILTSV